jgi:MYXO-CTERM domain-containing protein
MAEYRRIHVLVAIALVFCGVLAWSPIAKAQPSCCECDCGVNNTVCIGVSTNCDADCADYDECGVENDFVCVNGTFGGCEDGCNPICETPTATPTATATQTSTATATRTPVAIGGSCMDTAQCAPGLSCVNSICTPPGVPAVSPTGMVIAVGLLALIAAVAMRQRRRR